MLPDCLDICWVERCQMLSTGIHQVHHLTINHTADDLMNKSSTINLRIFAHYFFKLTVKQLNFT